MTRLLSRRASISDTCGMRLFLHDNGARLHFATRCYIVCFDPNQVAAAQLAIDSEVEQRQIPDKLSQLQPGADSPDLLHFQRRLRVGELAPCHATRTPTRVDRGFAEARVEYTVRVDGAVDELKVAQSSGSARLGLPSTL